MMIVTSEECRFHEKGREWNGSKGVVEIGALAG